MHIRQSPVALADGGAHRLDDYGFTHLATPIWAARPIDL